MEFELSNKENHLRNMFFKNINKVLLNQFQNSINNSILLKFNSNMQYIISQNFVNRFKK